eukprot:scaffold55315_cov29-Tisochrysis_lutea.AAC.3
MPSSTLDAVQNGDGPGRLLSGQDNSLCGIPGTIGRARDSYARRIQCLGQVRRAADARPNTAVAAEAEHCRQRRDGVVFVHGPDRLQEVSTASLAFVWRAFGAREPAVQTGLSTCLKEEDRIDIAHQLVIL